MTAPVAALSARMPYPGLRAFRREESDLFFGREDCINTMVDRLAAARFLAVLGSSGTGKSSLVRTGLLDALDLGVMAQAEPVWRVVDFRPGSNPLKNLARRLIETEAGETGTAADESEVDILRAFLRRGPRAVAEWCSEGHLPEHTNLLLLVDQFEELFRYQDYAGREEAEAFAALLTESARAAHQPIYVVLTMRSEYLGACALIENLAETISAGIFLTPRMTREQCQAAIVGPARVCDVAIEPALVNRLLNDLSAFAPWDDRTSRDQLDRLARRADQLPLLQYCLNLMWMRARDEKRAGAITLTLAEYERIGGLGGALNTHADAIFAALDPPLRPVAERVFRALTEGSSATDAVRRPTSLADLVAVCGGDEAAVRSVVDTFRAPGCNFLTPELDPKHPQPLEPSTFVDISHESLIRQWRMLSEWLAKEARAARQWRRLKERFEERQAMHATEVAQMLAWREQERPNAAWAERYGGEFSGTLKYLDDRDRRQRRFAPLVLPLVAFLAFWVAVAFLAGTEMVSPALRKADETAVGLTNAVGLTIALTCAFALWRYTRVGWIRTAAAAAAVAIVGVGGVMVVPIQVWLFGFPACTLLILAIVEPAFRSVIGWLELLAVGAVLIWPIHRYMPANPPTIEKAWVVWSVAGWPFWIAVIGDQLRRARPRAASAGRWIGIRPRAAAAA